MFIVYNPTIRRFLNHVYQLSDGLWPEWEVILRPSGLLESKEDALLMAQDVMTAAVLRKNAQFSYQVLQLLPGDIPDFEHPVYEVLPHGPS